MLFVACAGSDRVRGDVPAQQPAGPPGAGARLPPAVFGLFPQDAAPPAARRRPALLRLPALHCYHGMFTAHARCVGCMCEALAVGGRGGAGQWFGYMYPRDAT